jgi:hypothetical protein
MKLLEDEGASQTNTTADLAPYYPRLGTVSRRKEYLKVIKESLEKKES